MVITPSRYIAIAQIQLAQVAGGKGDFGPVTNIEDPAALIARFSLPTSYTKEAIRSCDLDRLTSSKSFDSVIKLKLLKGVPGGVDLQVYASSPEAAKVCALEIFNLIKNSQEENIAPFIEIMKDRVVDNQERILLAKKLIANDRLLTNPSNGDAIIAREEIRYLIEDNASIINIQKTLKARAAHLVAPIFTPNRADSPKRLTTLLIGFLSGLVVGIMFVQLKAAFTLNRNVAV